MIKKYKDLFWAWRRKVAEREAYLWRCTTCGGQLTRRHSTDAERERGIRLTGTLFNTGVCPIPHYMTSIPGAN